MLATVFSAPLSSGRSRLLDGALRVPLTVGAPLQPPFCLNAVEVLVARATSTPSWPLRPNVGLPQTRRESSSVCSGPLTPSAVGNWIWLHEAPLAMRAARGMSHVAHEPPLTGGGLVSHL